MMNDLRKYLRHIVLGIAALLGGASPAWAQVTLGAASDFAVLGGTNVTCTAGAIIGDVGVSPGTFTNTGCTITGGMPPATNAAAAVAQSALTTAYNSLRNQPCTGTLLSTITGPVTLTPGVYCTGAALTGTGVLTLDAQNNPNAIWIFKIGTEATGALTGTNFSVVMANGGQPCNVYWVPNAGVTMTTSTLSGNILAGDPISGSITFTDVTLAGSAMAKVAVSITRGSIIDCDTVSPSPSCKPKKHHGHGHDKDHKKKCNQGVGNGAENCDPGNSNHGNPFWSNDERGGKPGDPGRKGGGKK